MFELPKNTVHSIISKMMISEELHASWDQPTGSIVMHKVEPTRLQALALQFADKAALFVENNERMLDTKLGIYKFDQVKAPQKDQRGRQIRGDLRTQTGRFFDRRDDRRGADRERADRESRGDRERADKRPQTRRFW